MSLATIKRHGWLGQTTAILLAFVSRLSLQTFTATSAGAFTYRSGPLRRRITLIAMVLTTLAVLQATPVSAQVSTTSGGQGSAYFTCNDQFNRLSYGVTINPDTGRYGQTVAFRIYSQDPSTGVGAWAPWNYGVTGPVWYASNTEVTLPESLNKFYVRYAWLTSSGWRYAGEWITEYLQIGWYNGAWNGTFRYCDL